MTTPHHKPPGKQLFRDVRYILRKLPTVTSTRVLGVLKITNTTWLSEPLSCNGQRATKASLTAATGHHQ
ncbi:hypothetical protein EVAR_7987_1 [Eumeta japonica]|uniref:Uncharacterized protein n=1 Tax=Eumeta variegata TaxID=151549 RepID=A0A4C1TI31_EUMVA|nr:hypothetical protein EVAR_7987_1 [Eumeta japonica]